MKAMRLFPLLLAAAALGCPGAQTVQTIPTQPVGPEPGATAPEGGAAGGDIMQQLAGSEVGSPTKYFSPASAKPCPEVTVTSAQGQETKLQPGQAGYVTLLVFLPVDTPMGQTAVVHVSNLAKLYANFRVRAVGVVAKTTFADKAEGFAAEQGLAMPLYYDNASQSALRAVAGDAGADDPRALPAIFIIDRQLRLRFYRPGFQFVKQAAFVGRQAQVKIYEAAPEGKAIEDYLKAILGEG